MTTNTTPNTTIIRRAVFRSLNILSNHELTTDDLQRVKENLKEISRAAQEIEDLER